MKVGVLTFPGSNCDQDAVRIFRDFFEGQVDVLWHRDSWSGQYDLLVVPGGFSYGDYLRAGAIARFAPAMRGLLEHAKQGRRVIGICNGFQILCEAGLLPGALIRNTDLKHVCRNVTVTTEASNDFTRNLSAGRSYTIPVSHSDGNYRADADTLAELKQHQQIAFRYESQDNPNGSLDNIAGVTDRKMRVLGMMPHPERAVDPLTGGTDGRDLIAGFLKF